MCHKLRRRGRDPLYRTCLSRRTQTKNRNHPVAILLCLSGLLGLDGSLAWGQTITFTPFLTVSEEYDDNVLLTPTDRLTDFVTSVSPGFRITVNEQPWSVAAAASLRGVYYLDRRDLNSSTDNRQGSLAIEFRPTPRLSASISDTYVRSLDPGEVDPETGIVTGRFASTRNTVTPAVNYQVNPTTNIHLQYSFRTLRSDSPLAIESDAHELGAFIQRQLTPRTSGTLRYTFSRLQAEDRPARDAHLPTIGFAYALSSVSRISAEAGPLFREKPDGAIETTAGGRFQYEQDFPRGRLSLAFDRSARVAGVRGEGASTQSLLATVNFRLTRALESVLESSVRSTREPETAVDFLIYAAGLRIAYQLLPWLSVGGGYRYLHQDDRAGPLNLERSLFFISLTASTDAHFD